MTDPGPGTAREARHLSGADIGRRITFGTTAGAITAVHHNRTETVVRFLPDGERQDRPAWIAPHTIVTIRGKDTP